jgi:alpha-beta hydrolase superfamily lysophospholipase
MAAQPISFKVPRKSAATLRSFPGARYLIVAHSHGGNVALQAVSRLRSRVGLLGLPLWPPPFCGAYTFPILDPAPEWHRRHRDRWLLRAASASRTRCDSGTRSGSHSAANSSAALNSPHCPNRLGKNAVMVGFKPACLARPTAVSGHR